MKEDLVALTRSLGFSLCRVAACVAPPHAGQFRAWLDGGNAGEMTWLERNKDRRTDPQQVLPGAASVIVLAMNYWQGAPSEHGGKSRNRGIASGEHGGKRSVASVEPGVVGRGDPEDGPASPTLSGPNSPSVGKIARYAWGDDYHDLIEKKLRMMDDWLTSRGGRQRCYVDTGPVLERDFAALAGIGWHGKSTMLIHPRLGAWFFLAEILTTLAMPPDAPIDDHCGKCTRCIDICPTRAITAPLHVDARRCVSYLTIEHKGSIPEEFRVLIGDRIYGCDDCIAACPWNRFAVASQESAFAAREFVHGWSLRDFLALDDDGFRALFRKSPIKRIKRRGFLRNVCVALGNTGSAEDLPALERAAQDPEPLIAEHARWAVARIRERAGEEVHPAAAGALS